jgi:hypothetical protein
MLDSEQTKREKIRQFRSLADVPEHHDTESYLIARGWNLQRAVNDYFDNPGIPEETHIPYAGSFARSSSNPGTMSRTRHYNTVRSRIVSRYAAKPDNIK